ncbi:hypothetical protein ACV566_09350 [Staphylococcus aureus]
MKKHHIHLFGLCNSWAVSQPEYRKLKEKYSLFDITHQPELCAYVTHLPVDNYHTMQQFYTKIL